MKDNLPNTGGDLAKQEEQPSGGWLFPAMLVVVLVIAVGIGRWKPASTTTDKSSAPSPAWTPSSIPQGEVVGLTIDFGNGAIRQFEALPWRAGLTVEQLMQEAVKYRPGIKFSQQGEGEAGFLDSLDGLKNQGTSGRNWMYEVNDQLAETSFCLQELQPGDHVLWKFMGQE